MRKTASELMREYVREQQFTVSANQTRHCRKAKKYTTMGTEENSEGAVVYE